MNHPVYYVKNEKVAGFAGEGSPYTSLEALEWEALLETAYDTPALALPYILLDENNEVVEGMPRLNTEAIPFLAEQGFKAYMHSVWVDVDNEGHRQWESEHEFFDTLENVKDALGEHFFSCYWYMTPSGYRLVWRLDPLPVEYWRSYAEQLIDWLREHGIHADERALVRWNQLYRLPRVRKKSGDVDLPRRKGTPGRLAWSPSQPLDAQVFGGAPTVDVTVPDDLVALTADDWRKVKDSPYYRSLRQPHPLGSPGGRHNALVSCAADLTNRGIVDSGVLFAMMLPALQADQSPGAPDDAELRDVVKHAVKRQLQENKQNEEIAKTLLNRAKAKEQQRLADFSSGGEQGPPPTGHETAPRTLGHLFGNVLNVSQDAIQRAQNVPLERRLFLENGRSSYRYDERDGAYRGSFYGEGAFSGLIDAQPSFMPLYLTSKGALKSRREIFLTHSVPIERVVSVLGTDMSLYDPGTSTLYQGTGSFQPFLPTYHQDVQDWLELLGQSDPDALLDWLATFPLLSHPTAALYVHGAPGVGKGMLAAGLSRLFGMATPTSYADAAGRFNRAIEDCPLIWADEYIPEEAYAGRSSFSGKFRQMTGNSTFVIEQKYAPTRQVMGSLRVLITANNANVIRFDEQMSPEDFAAVSKRILYVRSDDQAAAMLAQMGGRAVTDTWVSSRIPEHVMWLMHNRPVVPGKRLLVEGRKSFLHSHLQRKVGINELLLEVIVTAIERGMHANGQILWGRTEVLVKPKVFHTLWETVHGQSAQMPSSSVVRSALRGLCDYIRRVRLADGSEPRYYAVHLDTLTAFSQMMHAFEGEVQPLLDKINDQTVSWSLKRSLPIQ